MPNGNYSSPVFFSFDPRISSNTFADDIDCFDFVASYFIHFFDILKNLFSDQSFVIALACAAVLMIIGLLTYSIRRRNKKTSLPSKKFSIEPVFMLAMYSNCILLSCGYAGLHYLSLMPNAMSRPLQ